MRSRELTRVLCLDIEGGYGGSSRSLAAVVSGPNMSAADLGAAAARPPQRRKSNTRRSSSVNRMLG